MNDRKKGMGPVRWIVLIAALAVFVYSGARLWSILSGYKAASDEYSSLADSFTKPAASQAAGEGNVTSSAEATSEAASQAEAYAPESTPAGAEEAADSASSDGTLSKGAEAESDSFSAASGAENLSPGASDRSDSGAAVREAERAESKAEQAERKHITYVNPETKEQERFLIEDAKPPLEVDWKELAQINPDIVGWVFVDGIPEISYPVLQGKDNDTYLHQTFRKQYLYAGSIFMDAGNRRDFADPNTVVYGHNMKDGSMFGKLKNLNEQKQYDAHPFFWILTPEGNYRYHIFSVFTTPVDSDTYTLYSQNGPEFLAWEKKQQEASEVKNDVELMKSDKTVILSTCTSDSEMRCVVIGKCVSTARPVRKQAAGLTVVAGSA